MGDRDPAEPDETRAFAQAEVRAHRPSRWFWSMVWAATLVVALTIALWPTSRDDLATEIATWGWWLCVLVAAWRLVVALTRAVRAGSHQGSRTR